MVSTGSQVGNTFVGTIQPSKYISARTNQRGKYKFAGAIQVVNESAPATKAKRSSEQEASKLASKVSVDSSMVIREASIVSVAPVSSDAGDVWRARAVPASQRPSVAPAGSQTRNAYARTMQTGNTSAMVIPAANESAPLTKTARSSEHEALAPNLAGKASVNSSTVTREVSVVSATPASSDAGDVSRAEGFDIGDHVQGLFAISFSCSHRAFNVMISCF